MRVTTRVSRLERGVNHAACAACGDALAGQVVYEVDGERVGSKACVACGDRAALILAFVPTPTPWREAVPATPADRERLVRILTRDHADQS